jgi:hypothetical protein
VCPVRTDNTLLMPAFALPRAPAPLPGDLHRPGNAPLPRPRAPPRSGTPLWERVAPRARCAESTHSVGAVLSPVTLSAPRHSTSELLRTLSRMAASKPTSWLSEPRDHLSHSRTDWGTLADGLGCFPLDDGSSHSPSHSTGRRPAFTVWLGSVGALPPRPSSSLPPAAVLPAG